jgi:hypothetical protein
MPDIECESCGGLAEGPDDYCKRCGEVTCQDCLENEWCKDCREEHWSELPDEVKKEAISKAINS